MLFLIFKKDFCSSLPNIGRVNIWRGDEVMLRLLDCFNLMEEIIVTEAMVEEWEQKVIRKAEKDTYVNLSDELNKITNLEISYNESDKEEELRKLTNIFSNFMAYQECLFNLMSRGVIMPVQFGNPGFSSSREVRINYVERQGNMTSTGDYYMPVPIFVFNSFMLKPSRISRG